MKGFTFELALHLKVLDIVTLESCPCALLMEDASLLSKPLSYSTTDFVPHREDGAEGESTEAAGWGECGSKIQCLARML